METPKTYDQDINRIIDKNSPNRRYIKLAYCIGRLYCNREEAIAFAQRVKEEVVDSLTGEESFRALIVGNTFGKDRDYYSIDFGFNARDNEGHYIIKKEVCFKPSKPRRTPKKEDAVADICMDF